MESLVSQEPSPSMQTMPDHEEAVLRYVSGATIHKVTKDFKESAQRHIISNVQKGHIEYKCYQLLQSLGLLEGYAMQYSDDPASLMEIIRWQHNTKGLTIVSDGVFAFFKYPCCKIRKIQTFHYLEKHRKTELQIKNDVQIIDFWCQLFQNRSSTCVCEEDTESVILHNQ